MRQMEGRDVGLASAATGGVNGSAPKYDRSKQGTAPGLASTAAAYNPDTDVTATAAGSEKKNKVGAPHLPQASFLQAVTGGIVHQATFLSLWPCRYSTPFLQIPFGPRTFHFACVPCTTHTSQCTVLPWFCSSWLFWFMTGICHAFVS